MFKGCEVHPSGLVQWWNYDTKRHWKLSDSMKFASIIVDGTSGNRTDFEHGNVKELKLEDDRKFPKTEI